MKRVRMIMMMVAAVLMITSQLLLAQRGMGFARGGGRGLGFAHGGGWAMMGGMGSGIGRSNIPNLTSDQIAKILQMGLDFQNGNLPLNTQIRTKQLELQTLMNGSVDQKKLEAKIDEINRLRTNSQKKWLAHRQNIRKLLTDDQKAWFDKQSFCMEQGFTGFGMGWGYGRFGGRGWHCRGNWGGWGRGRMSGGLW